MKWWVKSLIVDILSIGAMFGTIEVLKIVVRLWF